jgi:hypothetical protein
LYQGVLPLPEEHGGKMQLPEKAVGPVLTRDLKVNTCSEKSHLKITIRKKS